MLMLRTCAVGCCLTSISVESTLTGHSAEGKVPELLLDSYANDVETGIFKISIQGDPVRMVSTDRVRIVDSYNLLSVIRHQHNLSTLG